MNIKLICVGKLKERFYQEACGEFVKRLGRYVNLSLVELEDEKAPEQLSMAQKNQVKSREGKRILERIEDSDFVVAMAIDGRQLDSESFSARLQDWLSFGRSSVCFVIGGSLGLSEEVLKRSDFSLSFGKNTFPHQLFRIMLLEQIYRAFRIMKHEPYHK